MVEVLRTSQIPDGDGSPSQNPEGEVRFPNLNEVLVAGNRGPCGGVNMALEAATQVLDIVDGREPVYTNWSIVNNAPIMDRLKQRGLININNQWEQVPKGAVVFFSAHGIPPTFKKLAEDEELLTINTTCALVNRVHDFVKNAEEDGKHVIYIGAENHPEAIGVLGELQPENVTFLDVEKNVDVSSLVLPEGKDVVVYSQTTLSMDEVRDLQDALKSNFPQVEIPNRLDICYATENRQQAVDELLKSVDLLLVVGSSHSHNSTELKRKGDKVKKPSFLIDKPEEIKDEWFEDNIHTVGVTSGASVIEEFTEDVLGWFRKYRIPITYLPQVAYERSMTFKLPQENIEALKMRYE